MKKTLTYLLVVVALVALAASASAVTCTIDQRPAATLLVPYFQVHLNADGSVDNSSTRTDTLVTVVNASSQATLAHVVVWNRRSIHVLDFNIALTGFDVVSFSMEDILTGHLPSTPTAAAWENGGIIDSDDPKGPPGWSNGGIDVCQKNPNADTYPDGDGFLRFIPSLDITGQDNNQATTQYSDPAFGSDFAAELADELDYDANNDCDFDTPDGVITGSSVPGNGNLSGYVTIDMANFCTLSDPSNPAYWDEDAAGWENNLFGDYIIVTNSGIPTLGASTVQIEAALDTVGIDPDGFGVFDTFGEPFNSASTEGPIVRTFYARYWEDPVSGNFGDGGTITNGTEPAYMTAVFPNVNNTYGDEREPLGVRYGVRYLNSGGLTTNLRVWRASSGSGPAFGYGSGGLTDLQGPLDSNGDLTCSASEKSILAVVFDEDEGTQQINGCPSPCPKTTLNFPYETQRTGVDKIGALTVNGWAYLNFLGAETGVSGTKFLDQAWVDYEMSSGVAFVNASVPGTQLDPSTCAPLGVGGRINAGPDFPDFAWPVGLGH